MNMAKRIILIAAFALTSAGLTAQQPVQDTVVVNLTKSTKVVLTMGDRQDIDVLRHYDFQHLFEDIITKLEKNDTTSRLSQPADSTLDTAFDKQEENWSLENAADEEQDNDDHWDDHWKHRAGRTTQSFNFDLGTNNYVSNGKFPDSQDATYAVRPWGSWYIAANSVQRTRIGRNFFVEWGFGVSWYNFKFQKDNILIQKDDNGVNFVPDDMRDATFKKSKLTASYVNASLIPLIDFGNHERKTRVWDGAHDSFRIGLGPYIGYRIDSYSKIRYKEDGKNNKDKDHDSFYLENIRYGLRLQMGFRSTDLFFNYDMNELFTAGKGPSLNAFSFGVIF
jgi:hypothetical protein